MFSPKYAITPELLGNITQIHKITAELNHHHFSSPVLMEFLKSARALSTHASTSIEGNPLSLTEVKQILQSAPSHLRDSQQEVVNYNQALIWMEEHLSQSFDLDLALSLHKMVIEHLLPIHQSGKLRQFPVVVNNVITSQIAYIAPDVVDVSPLLADLFEFVKSELNHLDPLVLAGIFHKQFILIHPFMDGNGRTTRLLTKFLLAQLGLNTFKLFSFENYYNQNITKYFSKVGELGDYYELAPNIDFTEWLLYFTDGIIDELVRVKNLLLSQSVGHTLKPHHHKILTYLQTHDNINDQIYSKLVKRGNSTRAADFSYLVTHGFLLRKNKGPATYYILTT